MNIRASIDCQTVMKRGYFIILLMLISHLSKMSGGMDVKKIVGRINCINFGEKIKKECKDIGDIHNC